MARLAPDALRQRGPQLAVPRRPVRAHLSSRGAGDWVWLVDHTVQLGPHKGLVVVGLRLSAWQADPRPLEHQDVRLLHLEPMEHSDGQAVRRELQKVVARTGVPRQIVSDGGADLKKGVELFRQAHPHTTHTYDITHKVACLLKKELESDPQWERFVSESNLARRGLALTARGSSCRRP